MLRRFSWVVCYLHETNLLPQPSRRTTTMNGNKNEGKLMTDQSRLPDVHLTEELCADATIEHRYQLIRCCRNRMGTDIQSDYGEEVRCSNHASIKIRLATGQLYDLCEDHARLLGILTSETGSSPS